MHNGILYGVFLLRPEPMVLREYHMGMAESFNLILT